MTTSKQYDYLNRQTAIRSSAASAAVPAFAYSDNAANQRTKDRQEAGSYWVYRFAAPGQVTSGHKHFHDGADSESAHVGSLADRGQCCQQGFTTSKIVNQYSIIHL